MSTAPDVLRIGNCSGFYGDRLSAMREMLEGGELDVLTGDYLAELTMLILGRDRMKDPQLGYARTFLRQTEDCLGLALERGVRIIANAGGLNPAGLADKLREVAAAQGLDASIAYVQGDDLMPHAEELGLKGALTANAYLGGFGIAAALQRGADVVVTGRVTDASLAVGPAAWRFGWSPTQYDELAGAMVAGHVIECGAHATGGNFSGFRLFSPDATPLGFPIAEVYGDGSAVITKHRGTGGVVTTDTVTAQLVYEIDTPLYLGPDVSARLDTVQLDDLADDRVRVSGVRGEPPPEQLKVCVNELGGFRNSVELLLVGLDIDEKAAWVRAQMEAAMERSRPASVEWIMADTAVEDADTEEAASSRLRCVVKDRDAEVVGKRFTAAAVELALASYPGFTMTAPPAPASPYGVYRAAYVDRDRVQHTVVHADGTSQQVEPPSTPAALRREADPSSEVATEDARSGVVGPTVDGPGRRATEERGRLGGPTSPRSASGEGTPAPPPDTVTRRLPLGTFVHARSGDKGGDANIGLWVDRSEHAEARTAWLVKLMSVAKVRELVPEAEELPVEVHPLPNLGAVNIVIRGLLGEGVAASSRFDPQGKALGEWMRSRLVSITEDLL